MNLSHSASLDRKLIERPRSAFKWVRGRLIDVGRILLRRNAAAHFLPPDGTGWTHQTRTDSFSPAIAAEITARAVATITCAFYYA